MYHLIISVRCHNQLIDNIVNCLFPNQVSNTNLQSMEIIGGKTLEFDSLLSHIGSFAPQLRSLKFYNWDFDKVDIFTIQKIPHLKELKLEKCKNCDQNFAIN